MKLSFAFWKYNRNSGQTQDWCNGLPRSWVDHCALIYGHCWELMKSVGSYQQLVSVVMVCHFVSDSLKVMTAFIVVEISLQFHKCIGAGHVYAWTDCNYSHSVFFAQRIKQFKSLDQSFCDWCWK